MKRIVSILILIIAGWQLASAQNSIKDVPYGNDARQKMDVYLPKEGKGKTPAIILIHGGSWVGGDKLNMTHWLKPLQNAFPDDAIFNLNYRLANRQTLSNPWPAQIDDIDKAVAFIKDKAKDYRIDKKQLILLGESAGAQLALVEGFVHNTKHDVKVVVDLFGPADMVDLCRAHHELAGLMNGTPTAIPAVYADASAVDHVNKKSPATIIFHGTADPIVPIRESDSLNVRLKQTNVPVSFVIYPGKGHGWRGNDILDTYAKAIDFIKEQMK